MLKKIEYAWNVFPDTRFGQLLCNYIYKNEHVPFYEEDYVLEKRIDDLVASARRFERELPEIKKRADALRRTQMGQRLTKIDKDWAQFMKKEEKRWKDEN